MKSDFEERDAADPGGTGDPADPEAAQLRRILSELGDARDGARSLVAGLDRRQLRWRPEPDAWSVAQCLEHLVRTGEAYLPEIDRALARARKEDLRAEGPFSRGFLGRWLVRGMEPPPTMRVPAPAAFRPSGDHDVPAGTGTAEADSPYPASPSEPGSEPDGSGGEGAGGRGGGSVRGPDGDGTGSAAAGPLDRFLNHQDRLARRVREADGLDLEAVSVPAPVFSFVQINLMAAFAYLAAHQRRHLWQAREVTRREGFAAG